MIGMIGKTVRRGDDIRASDHNEIIMGLVRALSVRTTGRIRATWDTNGLTISETQTEDPLLLPARITKVYGSDPDLPANVKYDVQAIGNPDCKIVAGTPAFGRPVKGPDINFTKMRPAKKDAFCWILWDIDIEGKTVGKLAMLPGGSDGECVFYEACS